MIFRDLVLIIVVEHGRGLPIDEPMQGILDENLICRGFVSGTCGLAAYGL